MRAVAVLGALLFAAAGAQAQELQETPTCRADRRGEQIITRIEFTDGYAVEGPWQVRAGTQKAGATIITAVLDRIVETQALSRTQRTTPLPSAIEMTFRGVSQAELLTQAANVWCSTVMQAGPGKQIDRSSRETLNQHITP